MPIWSHYGQVIPQHSCTFCSHGLYSICCFTVSVNMLHIWPCLGCYMPVLGRVGRQERLQSSRKWGEKWKLLTRERFAECCKCEEECRSRGINHKSLIWSRGWVRKGGSLQGESEGRKLNSGTDKSRMGGEEKIFWAALRGKAVDFLPRRQRPASELWIHFFINLLSI